MCETAEKRAEGMEGNVDGLPMQWEEVGSSHKYLAFLVFYTTWRGASRSKTRCLQTTDTPGMFLWPDRGCGGCKSEFVM